MRQRLLIALIGLGLSLAAAEARASTPGDPFESVNRKVFTSSMAAERKYFEPIAKLYHKLTPGALGDAIHNALTNLGEPVVVINDLLQVRLTRALHDGERLIIDSTYGLGGVIDVGAHVGLPHQDNDFGITLGRWGVKPGPYLYLPILGPSTVRDAIGTGADAALNPLNFIRFDGRDSVEIGTSVVGAFDEQVREAPQLQVLLSGAADPYATLRSVYLQSREAAVRGEEATPALPPLPPMGEADPADAASEDAAATAPPAAASPVLDPPQAAAVEAAPSADGPIATAYPWDAEGSPAPPHGA